MNATCTDTRERATATPRAAAEVSRQLLIKADGSKAPCPCKAGTPGKKPGRESIDTKGRASEMDKVGSIVSAEQEITDIGQTPNAQESKPGPELPKLWATIMPDIFRNRDSKSTPANRFREFPPST